MVMMFRYQRRKITAVWTVFIFQMLWLLIESYILKCPSQSNWNLRAKVMCNTTSKYFCLFNTVNEKYVEECFGPDWDRKGSKRIYTGDFSRGKCLKNRFQPITFWTNESMSDCIFIKTICREQGQIIYSNGSTRNDRTCRCDHKQNFSFIKTPRNRCFCIPSEEDCSCYIKSCPVNFTLSADYECINSDFIAKPYCKNITRYNEIEDEQTVISTQHNHFYFSEATFSVRLRDIAPAVIMFLYMLFLIVAIGILTYADRFNTWMSKKLRPFGRRSEKTIIDNLKATKEKEDRKVHSQSKPKQHILSSEEVNFLRIIHLLFRVVCPVVRLIFNNEIQHNQLRKTLDKNKALLDKLYRRKDKIINDFQWDLLFKGEQVSSDDFDIRLMIYLLCTLANISIGDTYPAPINTNTSAMLSRIRYIRNKASLSCEGKLQDYQFKQFWDDIGQAVLKLVSSFKLDIENDQEQIRLIGRLLALNPFQFDNTKLCLFIDMSTTYPAILLQQLITEYCSLKNVTIGDVLKTEKHQLYHKRKKPEACCKCDREFSSSTKVITEEEWEALYEMNEGCEIHVCPLRLQTCCDRYVPRSINTCDLTVAIVMILNIPDMLRYMIARLCMNGVEKFLMQHQHIIYHSMEKKRCCRCHEDFTIPTKLPVIIRREWNVLFVKQDYILCSSNNNDCCCRFSVRNSIQISDDIIWSKIFYAAGPISIISKIKEDALSYLLYWNDDDKPFRNILTELMQLIQDTKFCSDLLHRTSSFNCSQSNDTKTSTFDAYGWFSRHLQNQTVTTVPVLRHVHIAVLDKSGLNMKSLQIPTHFPLHHINRKQFTDLTVEENNFLLVVHGLTKVVYPVIKKEFDTQCPDQELNKIRMGIQNKTEHNKGLQREETSRLKKKLKLTPYQQRLLFSPRKEESRKLDLKLMIYILKHTTTYEGNEEYVKHLGVIDSIRRKIWQSGSGTLSQKCFQNIMTRTREAILLLGGPVYEEKLRNLQNIRIL